VNTSPIANSSASTIAWKQGLETALITALVTALFTVLPELSATFAACGTQPPPGTTCHLDFVPILFDLLSAIVAGLVKAGIAFMAASANIASNAAVVASTPTPIEGETARGVAVAGTTVPPTAP
jgi:Ca2+/Na+ antiporter